jgi:hypothetical protein
MRFLALLLFAPTFALLTWLYWAFPRGLPRTPARRRFDLAVLALAAVATVSALTLAFDSDYGKVGPIWPQVAATLAAYHVFPVVLGIAWWWRNRYL